MNGENEDANKILAELEYLVNDDGDNKNCVSRS
jgi:hypothetical protein